MEFLVEVRRLPQLQVIQLLPNSVVLLSQHGVLRLQCDSIPLDILHASESVLLLGLQLLPVPRRVTLTLLQLLARHSQVRGEITVST